MLLTQQAKLEEGKQLEQQRMSEELHDGVLGRLFGVRLSLDGLNEGNQDGKKDSRKVYIEELKSIEREIRKISHDLGTDTLSKDIAYVDVVESLIKEMSQMNELEFTFKSNENINWEAVDDPKKVNLFRIIQESLQNIFKHAQANKVAITFDYDKEKVLLTIIDDGKGFDMEKVKRGIGLKNFNSRVNQIKGTIDIKSTIGVGTEIHIKVPVSPLAFVSKEKSAFSIAP